MSRKLLNVLQLWFAIFFAYIMATTIWQVLGWKIFPLAYLAVVGEAFWHNWAGDGPIYKECFLKIMEYFVYPARILMVMVEVVISNFIAIIRTIRAGRNGNLRPETTQRN